MMIIIASIPLEKVCLLKMSRDPPPPPLPLDTK